MAESALASALKPLGGSLASAEDDSYKSALSKIKAALDARENRPFDPTLLAMAQGFLSPTKTGSFGESLGQAAGAVLPVMQAEEKAGMENAQLRLQIAQAERAQALKNQGMAFLTGGANPAGGASGQVTKGDASGPGILINGRVLTPALIATLKYENKELGDALETQYKLALEDIVVQPGGFARKSTGVYTPFGGKALVQRVVPGVGKIDMPEEDAMALDDARRSGDGEKYWRIVDAVTKPVSRESKPSSTTAGAAPTSGAATTGGAAPTDDKRTTTASLEAEAAAAKERATVTAKSEAERTNLVKDAGKAALGAQASYARADEILKTPGIEKVMGLINKGDVVSAITNLVTDSLRVGNYTVGIPAIKKILTDSGVPQDVLNKALELAQLEAMWQMESRKGLGAGTSVSNMEQLMANRITPSQDDPMGAYKQKLAFLKEKGKFDIELSRALKRNKVTYDEFEDTEQFDTMFRDYQNRLMRIVTGEQQKADNKPAAQSGPINAEYLRNRLPPAAR